MSVYADGSIPNLGMILITVWACHRDLGRSVSTLRRLSSAAMALALMSARLRTMSNEIGFTAYARQSASALFRRDCSFSPPSLTPRALALARLSLVRMEIILRSFSANAA